MKKQLLLILFFLTAISGFADPKYHFENNAKYVEDLESSLRNLCNAVLSEKCPQMLSRELLFLGELKKSLSPWKNKKESPKYHEFVLKYNFDFKPFYNDTLSNAYSFLRHKIKTGGINIDSSHFAVWEYYLFENTRIASEDLKKTIRSYEIKYGEHSAPLNFAEFVLNQYALKWIPGFADSKDKPGRLELILNYTNSYVDLYMSKADELPFFSAFEFGLRNYLFVDGWGEGNIFKPAYISGGLMWASPENDIVRFPGPNSVWDDDDYRIGGFLTWGKYKAAALWRINESSGHFSSFALTRDFKVIPWVF